LLLRATGLEKGGLEISHFHSQHFGATEHPSQSFQKRLEKKYVTLDEALMNGVSGVKGVV